ncbi:MAG: glycosyltransferase family 4 protein [Candidatus Symbiothrix sp.]|jgi:UDP-N-acetylmuramyl pentapeptide phosphotransferase/UDP-N-acetylglucosamine-1-phosphate transferase|nr:glycosyltransferase family 4 protein [Candidatus Symbiothrix sp.]
MLQYILITIFLFLGMIVYFRIAGKYNIIDKPNERSSHNYITIRGGGIVFWLAGVLYSVCYLPDSLYFLTGITLISGISLWDDISSLPNRVRIVVHFLSISLIFYGLGLFSQLPWWLIVLAYIFFVGVMNAYNFMDGINGITGLYSLVILLSLQYVNHKLTFFTTHDFINYAIPACIVFLFFNFRKRAKCFAGDVGSLGVSFWIITLLLQLMLVTQSLIWILFLSVYGVDTIFTILHRLYLKQNIFQAHRMHFYQALSNERKFSHLKVSAGYAFVQLLVCIIIMYSYEHYREWDWIIGIIMVAILSIIYLFKFRSLSSPSHPHQN